MIKYFKNLWNSFWSKTDLDEKAIAIVKEVKTKIKKGKKPYYKNKRKKKTN